MRSLSPLGLVEENGKALRLEALQGELVLLFPKGSLLPVLLVSVVGVVGLLLVQPLSPWDLLFSRPPAEAHLEAPAKVRLLVEAVAGAWVQTARPQRGRA